MSIFQETSASEIIAANEISATVFLFADQALPSDEPGIIGADTAPAGPARRGALGSLSDWLQRLRRLVVCRHVQRRERLRRRGLATLDDRLLQDIGLTRCELLYSIVPPVRREVRTTTAVKADDRTIGHAEQKTSTLIALSIRPRRGKRT